MDIVFSKRFDDKLKKLTAKNAKLKSQIIKTIENVQINPGYPALHIHKLEGKETYSISVNKSIRIIFHWENGTVYFSEIGTHDEVY